MSESPRPADIAVVGVSALFPGSSDTAGFWADILAGADRITEVPASHWLPEDYYDADPSTPDKTYCKRGGFLDPVTFSPLEFGVPPNIVPATDASQLLGLVVARAVLDDASQGQFAAMNKEKISVILGVTGGQELFGTLASRLAHPIWRKALREHGLPEPEVDQIVKRIGEHFVPWQEASFPGLLGNVVAGRIAHRLDLGGTNCVVDAACASALSALTLAIDELVLGHSDLAIAGGVDTMNDPFMYLCFSKTPALSKTGECRPFDADGDGTLLGEGLGMVALKRLADAERDGDRVYAVIRAVGSSSDGLGPGIYAPVPEGQAKALRRAYEIAGYSPATVELVEGHGTGTRAGDAAELQGLDLVFSPAEAADRPWCALGSVKAQIGHTKAAAGVAGLIKCILALQHKILPPTIKVTRPNPALVPDGPFYLNLKARPWVRGPEHPRRASVSSFGFGGSNFHVALEEYTGPRPAARLDRWPADLVVLGAADGPGMLAAIDAALADLDAGETPARLARRSQESWASHAQRLALLGRDEADLRRKLNTVRGTLATGQSVPALLPGVWFATGPCPGKVAFLFPGQGSQSLDMGGDLAMALAEARAIWDHADGISAGWGRRLSRVVSPPQDFAPGAREAAAATLTETAWAQPALAVASLAVLAVLGRCGVRPDLALGHSFGELVALHAAGVFDADALLALARARGVAMAAAAAASGGGGAMAAVSGPMPQVAALLEEAQSEGEGLGVVMANHNAPDQVVLAGPTASLETLLPRLRVAGLSVRLLPVAAAFHSPEVAGAVGPLRAALDQTPVRAPAIPVYANTDALPYPTEPDAIRARLAEQIAHPVRFQEGVEALGAEGAAIFVEVGPGAVLTGLASRSIGGRPAVFIATDRPGEDGRSSLLEALGRLAVAGVAVDFAPLWALRRVEADPRAPKKKTPTMLISGTNPGRPYPPAAGASALPPPNPTAAADRSAPHSTPKTNPVPVRSATPPPSQEVPMSRPLPTPTAAPVAAAPSASPLQGTLVSHDAVAWTSAWTEMQRQTSSSHAMFQQSMHDAHLAYLRVMEGAFSGLAALAGVPVAATNGTAVAASAPRLADAAPLAVAPAAVVTPPPAPRPARLPERPAEVVRPVAAPAPAVAAPAPAATAAAAAADRADRPAPKAAPAPAPKAAPAVPSNGAGHSNGLDLQATLLEVVADKTGYPAEMLDLSMGLASDLGIDSIKRVEILSALRAKVPSLPELDMGAMASLRTLAAVLETLKGAQDAAPSASAKNPEPRRYLLVPEPTPSPRKPRPLPADTRRLALVIDRGGVAEALAPRLARRGLRVSLVAPGDALPPVDGAIFLAGPAADAGEALALCHAAFRVATGLAPRMKAGGGLFVTVQDTGGDFSARSVSAPQALLGGLAGLARTAAAEWPGARVQALDIAAPNAEAKAGAIEAELFSGGGEREVGLDAAGRRVTLVDCAQKDKPGNTTLQAKDVIVVTGGARGVTAVSLRALAARLPLRFVLLGRTPLAEEPPEVSGIGDDAGIKRALLARAKARGESVTPASVGAMAAAIVAAREVHQTLAALNQGGAEAIYLAVDVQDPAALSEALAGVRARWGPIAGIVHGAGVLADALLGDKSDAAYSRVVSTKVGGYLNLLAATAADPLRLVCVFSSVAARYGNAGQADYALGNEACNRLSESEATRRGPGCRVLALGWGPWEGGMVTPALKALFEARGVPLLPEAEGAALFADAVLGGPGPVQRILGGRMITAPAAPRPEGVERRNIHYTLASHPMLNDHRVRDVPVLPVVSVVDAFADALRTRWPGLFLGEMRGLRVLKGVRLPELAGKGHRLVVLSEPGAEGALRLRLETDADKPGPPLYRAEATASAELPTLADPGFDPGPLQPWVGDPYAEALFHGPAFQVLHQIEMGAGGARASLDAMLGPDGVAAGWSAEDAATDARALDGLLQLALLWSSVVLEGPTLPTGFARLRLAKTGAWTGPLRLMLVGRGAADGRAVSDAVIMDASGAVLAIWEGVENHRIPPLAGSA